MKLMDPGRRFGDENVKSTSMKTSNVRMPFSLVLLLTAGICSAQTLISPNKLWSVTGYGSDGPNDYQSSYVKFSGDTVINDQAYTKIWQSDDSLRTSWHVAGHVRENGSGNVYRYNAGTKEEEVMYAFGLQQGDSVLTGGAGYAHVDSVVYKPFGIYGNTTKFIYLGYEVWVGGVGSMGGVLNGLQQIGSVGLIHELVCYSENDSVKYHDARFTTCFPAGPANGITPDLETSAPSVTAFFSEGIIEFRFKNVSTRNASLRVFDLGGRLVSGTALHGEEQFSLPLNDLHGHVLLYFFQNKSTVMTGKIMVMNE